MCGIYMVALPESGSGINSKKAGEMVFSGLKKIEYRGYDSWGVAVVTPSGFKLKKEVGKLSGLGDLQFAPGSFALGHTRWATHGGVTKENAHPHLAKNGSFVLVQNGVVENFQLFKQDLLDWGYQFESETDTEIIVGLIEMEMEKENSKLNNNLKNKQQKDQQKIVEPTAKIIRTVFKKLDGRNTIVVLTRSGNVLAVRNGSPLIVGRNTKTEAIYLSSDTVSMSGDADEYLVINSGEMVEIDANNLDKKKKITILETEKGQTLDYEFIKMSLDAQVIDMEGFDNFMLKEIHEQAKVLHNLVRGKEKQFLQAAKTIKKAKTIFTLGAGTASFAAEHIAYLLRNQGLKAVAVASYEADSFRPLFDKDSVCIVFSQSGETADTNEVVEWMKEKGITIISAVNMPGSTLTQLSDYGFMLDVGPEQAVASTKAFFAQMLCGMVFSKIVGKEKFDDIEKQIVNFENNLKKWFANSKVQEKIRKLVGNLINKDHLFVLGRGNLYSSSLESALKLKEISYIHAEGFSGGELKHGVIALIEKGTPVLCLVAEDENKANMLSAIAEVNARGGYTIVVASKDNELYKEWIEVPEDFTVPEFMTLSSIVPSQLLTCYMAKAKGYDVDKPRNLAKSVTVK